MKLSPSCPTKKLLVVFEGTTDASLLLPLVLSMEQQQNNRQLRRGFQKPKQKKSKRPLTVEPTRRPTR